MVNILSPAHASNVNIFDCTSHSTRSVRLLSQQRPHAQSTRLYIFIALITLLIFHTFSPSPSSFSIVPSVSGQNTDGCAQCQTKSGKPLAACATYFSSAGTQAFLKPTDCEGGGGGIARLASILQQTKESPTARGPDGSQCLDYVQKTMCDYAVAATRSTSTQSCSILPMCQDDCDRINTCLIDGDLGCEDKSLVALGTRGRPTSETSNLCTPAVPGGYLSSSSTGGGGAASSSTGPMREIPTYAIARNFTFYQRTYETPTTGANKGIPQLVSTVPYTDYTFYGLNVTNVGVYLGIPFAEPPTGSQRWKEPKTPQRDAIEQLTHLKTGLATIGLSTSLARSLAFVAPANSCVQFNPKFDPTKPASTQSQVEWMGNEDCLYANVYSPYLNFTYEDYNCTFGSCKPHDHAVNPKPLLPVMVFLHGGNFANGSAYDLDAVSLVKASMAASAPIVVVTFNYRLGVFGFMAHSALSSERSPYQTSGLYGFEDQRFAMKYINATILRFGGDPFNITLVGEGSGAQMACMHVFSPASAGLFHKAILQGGACLDVYRSLDTGEKNGGKFVASLAWASNDFTGCESVETKVATDCLRRQATSVLFRTYVNISADRFLDLDAPFMGPLIDGTIFEDYPANIIEAASWNSVPMIMGTNGMEYAPLVGGDYGHIRMRWSGWVNVNDSVTRQPVPQYQTRWARVSELNRTHVIDFASGLIHDMATQNLPKSLVTDAPMPARATSGIITGVNKPFSGQVVDFWASEGYRYPQVSQLDDRTLRGEWNRDALRAINVDPFVDPSVNSWYSDNITSIITNKKSYCQHRRIVQLIGNPNSPNYNGPNALSKWVGKYRNMFMYRFYYQSQNDSTAQFGGAVQGSFLQYLTGTPDEKFFGNRSFTAEDRRMSNQIQYAWLNFMYYGTPIPDYSIVNITGVITGAAGIRWFQTIAQSGSIDSGTNNPVNLQLVGLSRVGVPADDGTQTYSVRSSWNSIFESSGEELLYECGIWQLIEHPGDLEYSYAPREAVTGQGYLQYDHCEPLAATSYCAGILNYDYVNLRGPFACQADVEQFLRQMPPIMAGLNNYIKNGLNPNIYWPIQNPALYEGGQVPPQYSSDTKLSDARAIVQPCMDSLAFATCRLLYRPCVVKNETTESVGNTDDTTTVNNSTTPGSSLTEANLIPSFTAAPCGSICHNYRFYCPLSVTSRLIAPIFDLHLPSPLSYDELFADCTNPDVWNATSPLQSNCTIISATISDGRSWNPTNKTDCKCVTPSENNFDYWDTVDTIQPAAAPTFPTCQKYNGTVCSGIINYDVYIPAGVTMAELEASAKFLIPLQLLATVGTGCRESFARHTCSTIFLACDTTAQARAAQSLGLTNTYNFQVPYPSFPCQHICSQALSQCTDLFRAAPQSAALVKCATTGVFWPIWKECPDPVYSASRMQTDLSLVYTQPVDYPPTEYSLVAWKLAEDVLNLQLPCNTFGAANLAFQTKVTVVCPYPLVIPDNFDAPSYAGGSCALPCASLLWTDEQWDIGDSFFNICVAVGFVMSLWLAISYTLFPVNRQRAYLHMFFISVFCLSLIYLMQIAYSGFKPHTFGCKNNSEISRQSDDVLCTLSGASFMYFVNASVQWWMVISLDLFNSLVRKKKYTVKQLKWQRGVYHAIAWGMPLIFVIVAAGQQSLGRTSTLPFCFMTDDTTVATEWGIMWIPLLARLLLGMGFMFYVARTMYQQGGVVERSGTGDRWGWFKMQAFIIALVVFFCLVFLWLVVYRAYMLLNDAAFSKATDDWIQCLIYARGGCGEKPAVYPVSLVWYGMIACVGAQGIACGLFFGFERRNFVLWSGFFQGKGRDYFTRPDVDQASRSEKGGGFWTSPATTATSLGKSGSRVAALSPNSIAIEMHKSMKKGNTKKSRR